MNFAARLLHVPVVIIWNVVGWFHRNVLEEAMEGVFK